MSREAVYNYVKKKKGLNACKGGELYAADGGEVPDEEEPDEESDDSKDAEPEATDSDAPAVPAADDQKQAAIKDYLMKQYGQAADDSGIKQAVEEQKHQNFIANLGEGLHEMATARAVANGAAPDSGHFFQGIRDQGKQGVEQAQAARQQAIQGVLTQNQLQQQAAKQQMAADEANPDSPKSQSFRGFIQSLYPNLPIPPGMSYATAKDKVPMLINAYEKNEANRQMTADKLAERDRHDKEHADEMDLRRSELKQRGDAVAGDRQDKATNADFDGFTKSIQGSIRDSIGGEKTKLRNTTHAQAILNKYSGKDLDNLTPEQTQEIGAAMASTISQGHPAEGLVHSMTPKSFHSDMSKALEYITGAPQSAGLGKQMELYKDMLQRQQDTSRDIISGELAPIIANKRHLQAKDKDRFDSILGEAGVTLNDKGKIVAYQPSYTKQPQDRGGQGGDGTAIAAPTTPPVDAIEAEMKRRGLKPKSSGASGGF